jgi:NADH-quinone oxidoreductase subunit M
MTYTLLPLFSALLILSIPRRWTALSSLLLSLAPPLALLISGAPSFTFHPSAQGLEWVAFGMQNSGLSTLMGWLVALSAPLLLVTALKAESRKRFHFYFHALNSSLYTLIFAADTLLFFTGWEMMGIFSYLLLSLSDRMEAKVLLRYILFAIASALSLLGGLVLMARHSPSTLFSDIASTLGASSPAQSGSLAAIALLLFFAFAVKAGSIGLHYWVADSYEKADDLFSAWLSAVVGKASIYAMILFFIFVLSIHENRALAELFSYLLMLVGLSTSIFATIKAAVQESPKRLLAYSSIAQVGYIVTAIGLMNSVGIAGALYHAIIHTMVKLLLFINVAGVISATGRDSFRSLGALAYRMPFSFISLLIAIIALAGIPPIGGFSSKFLIYGAMIEGGHPILLSAMMFASASAFIYCYKLIFGIYLGARPQEMREDIREVSAHYLIPQYIIVAALVILGLLPSLPMTLLDTILSGSVSGLPAEESLFSLSNGVGRYEGGVLMAAFIVVFASILAAMVSLPGKSRKINDPSNIAYCGERPESSLHYGASFASELVRIPLFGAIIRTRVATIYEGLSSMLASLSGIVRMLYRIELPSILLIATISLALLLWGGAG